MSVQHTDAGAVRASPAHVLILTFAASGLAILPLISSHHLPLLDAPGHEAHLAILRDLLISGRGSAFYEFDTLFLPNIAFETIGLGLVRLVDPETAGRIFFGAALVLTLWGVLVLNRVVVGRWNIAPLISALLLYNFVSIDGFLNYSFSLAIVPWALAARLSLQRARVATRLLLGAGFGIVLLFCHAFAFGIYATMSMGFALDALIRRRVGFVQIVVWALELVPAAALFLSMSITGQVDFHYQTPFFVSKAFGIVKSLSSASITGDTACFIGALLFFALLATYSRIEVARPMLPGLTGLAALYFALPSELVSGRYVDSRMPIAIAFLGLASLDLRLCRSTVASILVCLIAGTLVVKQVAIAVLWRSLDPMIDSFVAALARLPAGSIVMQVNCWPQARNHVLSNYRARQPPMLLLAGLASFDGSIL